MTIKSFGSTILQLLGLSLDKKMCYNEIHNKETKYIQTSAANLFHTGNLGRCICGHCKNEAREADCLIVLAKIPEYEERMLPFSYYGQLPDY